MSDDFDMKVVETEGTVDIETGADEQNLDLRRKEGSNDVEVPSAKLWPSTPEDWEVVRGSEVYHANPTKYAAEGKVDYIEMDALKTDLPDPKYVGRRDPSNYSGQMFAEGDTLFAQITPCTENGKAALVPELRSEVGIGSTEFIVLSPHTTKILPKYLYYLSKSHPVHNYAISRMRGSTGRQRVPVDVFRKELRIPLPPFSEQLKIASVLYTVDQAIQKTEAIIEKLRRIYVGTLQVTFPWGRGNMEQARKDDEIPTGWEAVELTEIADVTMGSSPKSKYYNSEGEGLPFYQGADEFGDRYPTPDRWCSSPTKVGEVGDVLMNIRSHTNVGKLNQSPHRCCIGRGVAAITPKGDIDVSFLFHHLQERERYVNSIASGSTFDSVNSEDLKTLNLSVPPYEVQEEIGARMDDIHKLIEKEKRTVVRYCKLRQGLMQDLLTGEIRTADRAIEVLDEVGVHG